MQRMEVTIRHMDDEDQVLSENSLSFQMLDVDSIEIDNNRQNKESGKFLENRDITWSKLSQPIQS